MIGAQSNRREFLIHSADAPLAWGAPWAGFFEQAQEKQEASSAYCGTAFPGPAAPVCLAKLGTGECGPELAQVLATTEEKDT